MLEIWCRIGSWGRKYTFSLVDWVGKVVWNIAVY